MSNESYLLDWRDFLQIRLVLSPVDLIEQISNGVCVLLMTRFGRFETTDPVDGREREVADHIEEFMTRAFVVKSQRIVDRRAIVKDERVFFRYATAYSEFPQLIGLGEREKSSARRYFAREILRRTRENK